MEIFRSSSEYMLDVGKENPNSICLYTLDDLPPVEFREVKRLFMPKWINGVIVWDGIPDEDGYVRYRIRNANHEAEYYVVAKNVVVR